MLTTAMAIGLLLSNSANAGEREYFQSVQGKWSGAGTIVAGPYKNTRFTCNFDGNAPKGTGMELTGKCRVGLFSQPMSAKISKKGSTYRGQFLDGASGKGLDIVSGRLRGQKLLLGIKRKQLNGTMVASLNGPDKLNITIAVRVNRKMIPFIGVTLKRTGSVKRASLASQ
ncbi:MAG: hypothetical protein AAGF28_09920 [Pseudomonadota bacterium]